MVRFLNLEEDVDGDALRDPPPVDDDRPNPNLNQFSVAMSCYPIVSQLAASLDLNSLHELSHTCRQVRANLLQHRDLLVTQTLRCVNADDSSPEPATAANGRSSSPLRQRLTRGKNCVIKTPPASAIQARHRRLCRACMKAPLSVLTSVDETHDRRNSKQRQTSLDHRSNSDDHNTSSPPPLPNLNHLTDLSLTTTNNDDDPASLPPPRTFTRSPCTCATRGVWICQPCGHLLRAADTTYQRGWTWRTRYAAWGGGGLGAGLAEEGPGGVECARAARCLAARPVEADVEVEADVLYEPSAGLGLGGGGGGGGSYAAQEVVGIGGAVKQKARRCVWVGAGVKEYPDERAADAVLGRERSGGNRSWCAWCARVVLGRKDREEGEAGDGGNRDCSSASSETSEATGWS